MGEWRTCCHQGVAVWLWEVFFCEGGGGAGDGGGAAGGLVGADAHVLSVGHAGAFKSGKRDNVC